MLNTLTAYWHNDTPHQAEPLSGDSFVIVMDPARIFKRGNSFERQDMAISLWKCAWTPGLVVRDLRNNMRYRVVEYCGRHNACKPHQRLESLCGRVRLVPESNGNLREERDG